MREFTVMPVCPVCGQTLRRDENTLRCGAGHGFDIARQGYVNLLTVDRKHSLHPGDTKEMVLARREFLDAGFYAPVARKLAAMLAEAIPGCGFVLDAGCGEGYYLSAVADAFPDAELWGLDISKDAVRFAAGKYKNAGWIAGTAAALPFPDGRFDAVLSMFALTVPGEYLRVLKPGGVFLQVLAGEEHLLGLKRIIYPELLRKEKQQEEQYPGFALLRHETLAFDFTVPDNRQVRNLLSMTPHYWRISKEGAVRLENTQTLRDRAQVVFNLYRKL